MQNSGFNVCTCGNCGEVLLYNTEMKQAEEVECYNCNAKMQYCDNPDFYSGTDK